MTNLVLTFNGAAAEKLGANSRLRVKTMKRGGEEFVALRPSYRVSGKNTMIRTIKGDDGTVTAELPDTVIEEMALPEIKSNHTNYLMFDAGYGWFLMKDGSEANEKKDAIITVSKARKSAAKKAKQADDTQAEGTDAEASEGQTQTTDENTSQADTEAESKGDATEADTAEAAGTPEAEAPVADGATTQEQTEAPARKVVALKKGNQRKAADKAADKPAEGEPVTE